MCTDSAGLAVPDDGLAGVMLSLRTSPHVLPSRLPPCRGSLTRLACLPLQYLLYIDQCWIDEVAEMAYATGPAGFRGLCFSA